VTFGPMMCSKDIGFQNFYFGCGNDRRHSSVHTQKHNRESTKTRIGVDFGFSLLGLNHAKVMDYHQFNKIDALLFFYPQRSDFIVNFIPGRYARSWHLAFKAACLNRDTTPLYGFFSFWVVECHKFLTF